MHEALAASSHYCPYIQAGLVRGVPKESWYGEAQRLSSTLIGAPRERGPRSQEPKTLIVEEN